MATVPPPTCDIAFKEWAGVCRALVEGRQTLILRKGGISERPGGFAPDEPAFWLYPTELHEHEQGLKPSAAPTPSAIHNGLIALPALVLVEDIHRIERLETLAALSDQHVWTDETIEKRFHYRQPGLWLLIVRVLPRAEPWSVPIEAHHAGCKSWVRLSTPLSTSGCEPVLDGEEFERRRAAIQSTLSGSSGS